VHHKSDLVHSGSSYLAIKATNDNDLAIFASLLLLCILVKVFWIWLRADTNESVTHLLQIDSNACDNSDESDAVLDTSTTTQTMVATTSGLITSSPLPSPPSQLCRKRKQVRKESLHLNNNVLPEQVLYSLHLWNVVGACISLAGTLHEVM
jgi:hypothetical protein